MKKVIMKKLFTRWKVAQLVFMIFKEKNLQQMIRTQTSKEIGFLPIIQNDMVYQKIIFRLKSKFVYEMMEGDLEVKDYEQDLGEVNLIN